MYHNNVYCLRFSWARQLPCVMCLCVSVVWGGGPDWTEEEGCGAGQGGSGPETH